MTKLRPNFDVENKIEDKNSTLKIKLDTKN